MVTFYIYLVTMVTLCVSPAVVSSLQFRARSGLSPVLSTNLYDQQSVTDDGMLMSNTWATWCTQWGVLPFTYYMYINGEPLHNILVE